MAGRRLCTETWVNRPGTGQDRLCLSPNLVRSGVSRFPTPHAGAAMPSATPGLPALQNNDPQTSK